MARKPTNLEHDAADQLAPTTEPDAPPSQPPMPAPAPGAATIVVGNMRGGPYTAVRAKGLATSEASDSVHVNDSVVLWPGLSIVDAELWGRVSQHPGCAARVASGDLIPIEDWSRCPPAKAIELISETGTVSVLEQLQQVPSHPRVLAAIEQQLAKARDPSGTVKATARRLNMAHLQRG